jgi:hypothetical protein
VSACTWCGRSVDEGEGFRAYARERGQQAVFCRLEHVVPWAMRGAAWAPGAEATGVEVGACSWCDAPLGDDHVLLVRARGEHRVADGFCDADHLAAWAKAGGRWAT